LPPKQTLRLVQLSFANRYFSKAIFAKAWAVTVVDLLGLRKSLPARFSYPPDDPQQNYGGFPLYQGITNSLVSASLGILCNDSCEGHVLVAFLPTLGFPSLFDQSDLSSET